MTDNEQTEAKSGLDLIQAKPVTTQNYWNRVWAGDTFVEALSESNFYFGRKGIFGKMLIDQVGPLAGKKVIEFGGGGHNLRLLSMTKWHSAQVTALDYSDAGLEKVKHLFVNSDCSVNIVKQNLLEWKLTGSYDLVCHWGLLEHFKDPKPILAQSALALASGERLIFSMPNMNALGEFFWRRWSPENWSLHVNHSDELLIQTLNDLGFTEIQSFYFGVPWLKMGPWEKKSFFQYGINLLQFAMSAAYRILIAVFPLTYKWNSRLFLMERVFVARKK